MRVTFLEGYKPLVKTFTPERVDSYPQVKRVTSHEFEVDNTPDGLREKFALLQRHAAAGCGMLKGHLIRQLVKESRSGMTANEAPATNIVLDIDGVAPLGLSLQPPYNAENIREIAEHFIQWLPEAFHNSSYIVHASASLGTKPGIFSLHLDFMLDSPIPPQILKDYLTSLNFEIPQFEQQLTLTATGTALRYKLDRTLADNSRIIYVAHPIFEGVPDPIPDPDSRLQLVEKASPNVILTEQFTQLDTSKLQRKIKQKITYLRNAAGLPIRKENVSVARINGMMVPVVTNPDSMHMEFSYENGKFVYYNINGGDSNAYYVYKDNPTVVHNFKGEPNFLFESADPDTYRKHLEQYRIGFQEPVADEPAANGEPAEPSEPADLVPMVFRDKAADKFYNAMYDPQTQQLVEINSVRSDARCGTWMREHHAIEPDIIPSVDFVFAPDDPRTIDMANRFINRYNKTPLLRTPVAIPETAQDCCYGYAGPVIEDLCPTIYKVIFSITGCHDEITLEFEHFINWLAYVIQRRDKTQTAWVLHGVPGTGKGVFMHDVISPILGLRHTPMIRTENVDEQYNSWLTDGILVALDEFNASDAKIRAGVLQKLKNYITEPMQSIREMYSDTRVSRNYTNFIFFSNDEAPIVLENNDRRYNVAPAQKIPLAGRFPGILTDLIQNLRNEAPAFTSFLLSYKINVAAARTALDNKAKEVMTTAAKTSVDLFCDALREGNLDYFLEVMQAEPTLNPADPIFTAQKLLKNILVEIKHGHPKQRLSLYKVRALYHATVSKIGSEASLGKILRQRGIETVRAVQHGVKMTVCELEWDIPPENVDFLIRMYKIPYEVPSHIHKAANNTGARQ